MSSNYNAMMFLHVSASSTRLVCYYDSSAENRAEDGKFQVSDIDPNQCTHLIYAFSDINNQHELVPNSEADIQRYESFNGLKTRSVFLASRYDRNYLEFCVLLNAVF